MPVHMLGAIGTGYPIRVRPGNKVSLNELSLKYWGPATSFYVCWGIKRRGLLVRFDNGGGLLGNFGYASISVPASSGELISIPVRAELTIPEDAPKGKAGTFIWLSNEPSTDESKFLFDRGKGSGAIDTDDNILDIGESPIPSPVLPAKLSASYKSGIVEYAFSGMKPNSDVSLVVVETGGGFTHTADSSGSGSGSFEDGDPPGSYTLKATDPDGKSASAKFAIGGSGASANIVSLDMPGSARQGDTVISIPVFSYEGPTQDIQVEVSLGASGIWPWPTWTTEGSMTETGVIASLESGTYSVEIGVAIPYGVPEKNYDALVRILDTSGVELASKIKNKAIDIGR